MALVNIRQTTAILLMLSGMLIATSGWADKGHELCTDCHLNAGPDSSGNDLVFPVTTLCTQCHRSNDERIDHAIGIPMAPGSSGSLPLIDGKIECVTCHDAHVSTKGFLRLDPKDLCASCHQQY